MSKLAIFLVFLVPFLGLSSCTGGSADVGAIVSRETYPSADEAVRRASDLYSGRSDLGKVRRAIEVLGSARNPEKRAFDIEWRFAKYCYYLGSRENVTDEEAESVLKKGIVAARIAKRLRLRAPQGYFWEAALLGERARRNPVTVGIMSIGKIRRLLRKVIEIDPGYQGASAYLALGQVELNSRGFAGGSAEKAVTLLEKGMKIEKNNSYLYLYLAEAYFAVDRDRDAKRVISDLNNHVPDPDYIPEYEEATAKANKLLRQKS